MAPDSSTKEINQLLDPTGSIIRHICPPLDNKVNVYHLSPTYTQFANNLANPQKQSAGPRKARLKAQKGIECIGFH